MTPLRHGITVSENRGIPWGGPDGHGSTALAGRLVEATGAALDLAQQDWVSGT